MTTVPRVLINKSGSGALKISLPGYNATTATGADQFVMDTASNHYQSLFLQGSIALASFTHTSGSSGGVTYDTYTYVLSFGTTFASPPIVQITNQDPIQTGTWVGGPFTNDFSTLVYGGGGFVVGSGGACDTTFVTTTTQCTITISRVIEPTSPYSSPIPAFTNYTVLRTS